MGQFPVQINTVDDRKRIGCSIDIRLDARRTGRGTDGFSAIGLMFLFALGAGIAGPLALTKALSANSTVVGSAAGLYGFHANGGGGTLHVRGWNWPKRGIGGCSRFDNSSAPRDDRILVRSKLEPGTQTTD